MTTTSGHPAAPPSPALPPAVRLRPSDLAALASVGASRAGALGAQAPRGGAWGEDC